jgi:hypothetical protein
MNDRVEDYRQLLERRRAGEGEDSKRGSGVSPRPVRVAQDPSFRTGAEVDS